MNRMQRNAAEVGLIIVAGAALVWVGGAGAVAGDSATAASSSVGSRSPVAKASPPRDRDCRDFASQAAAQAALTPDDRERLDADRDGVACEELFGNERQQVRVHPSGPVQTGGFTRG